MKISPFMPNTVIIFPEVFVKLNHQNQMKKNSLCTNNRNVHFCNLDPFVWERVGL